MMSSEQFMPLENMGTTAKIWITRKGEHGAGDDMSLIGMTGRFYTMVNSSMACSYHGYPCFPVWYFQPCYEILEHDC